MFYLTILNKVLRHCHFWLARQYLMRSVKCCIMIANNVNRDQPAPKEHAGLGLRCSFWTIGSNIWVKEV